MKHNTILLIEDDYLDVESVKRAFKKLNVPHILYVAHNGADALKMLTAEGERISPDIILLDINMPKMNGLEFLRIIKNYHSLKNIKLFVITTSGEEYDKIAAHSSGISGYITKPLNFSDPRQTDAMKLLAELNSQDTI